jgi:hypothetical protein
MKSLQYSGCLRDRPLFAFSHSRGILVRIRGGANNRPHGGCIHAKRFRGM